ncbi:MAG: beta-N-acetylhexosaminidase [Labilithrix sp.]|nr:beta-N-acetylhexosaminidase [Labilithrix sp.]
MSALCGQMLVVGLEGTELTSAEERALAAGERGGVVLFRRNVTGGIAATAALTRAVARAAPADSPPLVAVDQEGGRVMRLGPPLMPLPPMRRLGDLDDVALTTRVAEAHARELAALGFTMSFAPVADVHTRDENPIIGDRAFGTTPERVARIAGAWAAGLVRGGLLACAKHFPGHGDTTVDSHLGLPRVDRPRAELDAIEIAPFRALAKSPDIAAMMSAHVVYTAIDADQPATLSPAICRDLLRADLGFEGVLFSDDLEMKAIAVPVSEAAVRAVLAGCDVLLVCSRAELAAEAHEALVREAENSGAFRARCEEAAARSLAMRRRVPPRPAPDDATLARTLDEGARMVFELTRRLSGEP